jgi:hypothetical protein
MTKCKAYSAITLFLMFAMTFSLLALPQVNAQAYKEKTTYAYVIATPNPDGIGQPAHLIFGITDYLYQYPDGWTGITVTVTKPDGTTETLGPSKQTQQAQQAQPTYLPQLATILSNSTSLRNGTTGPSLQFSIQHSSALYIT